MIDAYGRDIRSCRFDCVCVPIAALIGYFYAKAISLERHECL